MADDEATDGTTRRSFMVGGAAVMGAVEEAVLNALTGTLDVGIDYPLPTSNSMPAQQTTPARPNIP